jgi:peroxiredoxin
MTHLKVGSVAPNVEVLTEDSTVVQLSDYWEKGTVLLSFLRHFG